ncbi:MAG TPA: SdiA-regulated domain-containing protein [Cyclobacteriaceae bacterium]|nr:SdiA-regulated domain-containing protein [Cyclobacteriaceae bacterium]
MIIKKTFLIALLVGLFLMLNSCGGQKPEYASPEGYDFANPEKMLQKESLLEISGISFLGKGDTLLSVNDEEGKVFLVSWMGNKNRSIRFSSQGDFEDVTHYKNRIFIIRSDGTVYVLPDTVRKKIEGPQAKVKLPKGEYESIFADEQANKLYVLCKRPRNKKDENRPDKIFGHVFTLFNDSITGSDNFKIDLASLPPFKNPKKLFAPSAFAKNNATNEWYILSSANKVLLIADADWKPKAVYPLNPDLFNQPEGLAFDKDNNLYISNEGDELQYGNILKFTFSAPTH